jgi:hypothetical protein
MIEEKTGLNAVLADKEQILSAYYGTGLLPKD